MKARFVNESINWSEPDEEKFRESWINEIRNFSSTEEIDKHVFEMTCGHHFPFNPIEPLRSAYREKILELKTIEEKEQNQRILDNLLERIKGEWKPIELPPGAMY
jgi:hypothetical protein